MINRKALAAAVLAAAASVASAQDYSDPFKLATTPAKRPLMQALSNTGVGQTLEDWRIDIYGHIEVGYTYNFDDPSTNQNAFRVFDFEHNECLLNQINLSVERRVDYRKNQWDWGGLMEWLYGGDAGLIHANGVFDWYDSPRDPENQFDPTQFYIDVTMPVLNGMRLRMGKFVNLVGYESINPTQDFIGFYSRSYVFAGGYPFTHMGVLATFDPTKNLTLTLGITRGDEQGFEDNNDAVSFLGSLNWVINKQMALYISNSTGPEAPDNESDLRTTWDATFYWQPTEKCKFLANLYFVYDAAGGVDGDGGYLYSLAALGSYQLCQEAIFKVRGEFLHDEDGLRYLEDLNLFEITVGLDVIPFATHALGQNLIIRPEFRFDFADEDVFDGGESQVTFGVDAIFKY